MHEIDFTEADLSQSVFKKCDLMGSTFQKTNLEKADFCSAQNFNIQPELNSIKKAKFSPHGILGLVLHHDIVVKWEEDERV